ncbi:TPA: hypothetical protein ACPD3N_000279 [Pasteurella multocida]
MRFHDSIEAGKWLMRLTAAEIFCTYALENQKRNSRWSEVKKVNLAEKKVNLAEKKVNLASNPASTHTKWSSIKGCMPG